MGQPGDGAFLPLVYNNDYDNDNPLSSPWSPWVLAILTLSTTNLCLVLLYWAVLVKTSFPQTRNRQLPTRCWSTQPTSGPPASPRSPTCSSSDSSSPPLPTFSISRSTQRRVLSSLVKSQRHPQDSVFSVVSEVSALAYALIYSSLFVRHSISCSLRFSNFQFYLQTCLSAVPLPGGDLALSLPSSSSLLLSSCSGLNQHREWSIMLFFNPLVSL